MGEELQLDAQLSLYSHKQENLGVQILEWEWNETEWA